MFLEVNSSSDEFKTDVDRIVLLGEDVMTVYMLPALLALLIKLVIVFYAFGGQKHSKVFAVMVSIFAIHNICEVLVLLEGGGIITSSYILLSYYVTSIWALLAMLVYVSEVSRIQIPWFKGIALCATGLLTAMILFSQGIIGGERSLGYTVTAVRGPFYWVFQAFSLTAFVSAVLLLIKGTKYSEQKGSRVAEDHMVEIQSSYTLLALSPIVIVGLAIMILMNIGVQINAVMVFPVATTLFLLVTLKSEAEHKLTDLRRFLPWSKERRTSREIMEIFSSYSRDDANYRDAVGEIEKLLVLHKYQKSGGNASKTAQQMGMPRSSLYSIFNRLSIKVND